MKLREHLMFLALMIPTLLLLSAGAVSLGWLDSSLGIPQDPQTLAITEFLRAQLAVDQVLAEAPLPQLPAAR